MKTVISAAILALASLVAGEAIECRGSAVCGTDTGAQNAAQVVHDQIAKLIQEGSGDRHFATDGLWSNKVSSCSESADPPPLQSSLRALAAPATASVPFTSRVRLARPSRPSTRSSSLSIADASAAEPSRLTPRTPLMAF